MLLRAVQPQIVTFTRSNAGANVDNQRRERVEDAAKATGAAGAGVTATRSAAFKMFKSSNKVAGVVNGVAEGARAINQPIKESTSLWNALKVNYGRFTRDIAEWAKNSRMPGFMKGLFTGKLGSAIGGVGAVFVFITGIAETFDTFAHKLQSMS